MVGEIGVPSAVAGFYLFGALFYHWPCYYGSILDLLRTTVSFFLVSEANPW